MSGEAHASSFQHWLDELTRFATPEAAQPDLVAAKRDYFARTGELFDDDKQFEMRMASFLEHYLFDRPGADGQTPAQRRYAQALREGPPEVAAAYRSFTETVHGLFEVRRLGRGFVLARDLGRLEDYEVTERRAIPGLQVGDVLEARLIPFGGGYWFSSAFVCHPRAAFDLIRREARRRRKAGEAAPSRELAWDCAQRSLKADRYRNIAIDRIYDFRAT